MGSVSLVLAKLGIDYRQAGSEAVARCPAHDDLHPSWSCNLKTGAHYCFSCGFSGNLAQLVSYVLGLAYPAAVIWVNSEAGWARSQQWREDIDQVSFMPQRVSEADMALFTDPPAEKLAQKKISLEAARFYGVRWNPQENTWIFPIRDPVTSDLWGWQLKNERYFRSYPGGIRKSETLFGVSVIEHGRPVVLVESPVDAVRLRTAGIRNGVSSFGVQVSVKQLALIQRNTEHLILALDNDSAGISGTARVCDAKPVSRVSVYNYGSGGGKDPGEQTDEQVIYGIDNAVSSIAWMREYKNSERKTAPIPARASTKIPGKEKFTSRLRNGPWKDSHRDSSSRASS